MVTRRGLTAVCTCATACVCSLVWLLLVVGLYKSVHKRKRLCPTPVLLLLLLFYQKEGGREGKERVATGMRQKLEEEKEGRRGETGENEEEKEAVKEEEEEEEGR